MPKSDVFEIEAIDTGSLVAYGRRTKDGEVKTGVLTPLKEGQPITGDAIKLNHCHGNVYEVETLYDGKAGPCRANSAAYRSNYDSIFGEKKGPDYGLN